MTLEDYVAGEEDTYQVQPNICHQNLIFLILERVEKELVDSTWMKSKHKSFKLMNNLASLVIV